MDYVGTYPHTYIRYHASNMILNVDSDAAYLVAPKARSRVAGFFHLLSHPTTTPHPSINGAILVECKTLCHVVSSAVKAETAALYHNAQMAVPLGTILEALNHKQPPTTVKMDNSTANGFIHDNIHIKKSKLWDMQYHWLQDRENQNQFHFYWQPGKQNYVDYFSKHHATTHHRQIRTKYVKDKINYLIQRINHLQELSIQEPSPLSSPIGVKHFDTLHKSSAKH